MKHVGRFKITDRDREELPELVKEIMDNVTVLSRIGDTYLGESERFFDADEAEHEYRFILDEKQAFECVRVDVEPVVVEPVKVVKKVAKKKGKAV